MIKLDLCRPNPAPSTFDLLKQEPCSSSILTICPIHFIGCHQDCVNARFLLPQPQIHKQSIDICGLNRACCRTYLGTKMKLNLYYWVQVRATNLEQKNCILPQHRRRNNVSLYNHERLFLGVLREVYFLFPRIIFLILNFSIFEKPSRYFKINLQSLASSMSVFPYKYDDNVYKQNTIMFDQHVCYRWMEFYFELSIFGQGIAPELK